MFSIIDKTMREITNKYKEYLDKTKKEINYKDICKIVKKEFTQPLNKYELSLMVNDVLERINELIK